MHVLWVPCCFTRRAGKVGEVQRRYVHTAAETGKALCIQLIAARRAPAHAVALVTAQGATCRTMGKPRMAPNAAGAPSDAATRAKATAPPALLATRARREHYRSRPSVAGSRCHAACDIPRQCGWLTMRRDVWHACRPRIARAALPRPTGTSSSTCDTSSLAKTSAHRRSSPAVYRAHALRRAPLRQSRRLR